MTVVFALLILGAYLLGSVPAAYLVAKWSRGIDIRKYGSGNVGASNIIRIVSKRWAIPVVVFDVGKGAVMVWATTQLIGPGAVAQQVTVGLVTIIGHCWPVFLRFNGGRGALTTLGVVFALTPWLAPILIALTFLFYPFRQLALGTTVAMAALPLCSWFLRQPFGFGIEERLPVTLGYLAIFLIVIFRRLTTPRTSLSASVPTGQLIINRLLLDRDVRDKEAWIHRAPPEQQEKQEKG